LSISNTSCNTRAKHGLNAIGPFGNKVLSGQYRAYIAVKRVLPSSTHMLKAGQHLIITGFLYHSAACLNFLVNGLADQFEMFGDLKQRL